MRLKLYLKETVRNTWFSWKSILVTINIFGHHSSGFYDVFVAMNSLNLKGADTTKLMRFPKLERANDRRI